MSSFFTAQLRAEMARVDTVRACFQELRGEVLRIPEDIEAREAVLRKLENLHECIFETDEWTSRASLKDGEPDLRLTILGKNSHEIKQLLNRFLCGTIETDESQGARRKNVLEMMTGVKSPKFTEERNKYKTSVPCHGVERRLLIRVVPDDPGPHALHWSDGVLITYNKADPRGLEECRDLLSKVHSYKKPGTFVCFLAALTLDKANDESQPLPEILSLLSSFAGSETQPSDVEGEGPSSGVVGQGRIEHVEANPTTGLNVDRLFNDLVHLIADKTDAIMAKGDRIGRLEGAPLKVPPHGGVKPRLDDMGLGRSIPIHQGQLKKVAAANIRSSMSSAKRWVTLAPGAIVYYNSLQEYMDNAIGKQIPLMHTTLKTPRKSSTQQGSKSSLKERHAFTIVSMDGRSWHFEAKDSDDLATWVAAIEGEIHASINRNLSDGGKNTNGVKRYQGLSPEEIEALVGQPGNGYCADCGTPDPDWASLNLAILICIECSGIHRNLGVHISRVRSLDLDDWKRDHIAILNHFGNDAVNRVYEAHIPEGYSKPEFKTPRNEKENWIREKYIEKRFLRDLGESPALALMRGLHTMDQTTFEAFVHCNRVEVNYANPANGQTPLHVACAQGNAIWTQLLIWGGAEVNTLDLRGHTPLYHAKRSGNVTCSELLLDAGCEGIGTLSASSASLPLTPLFPNESRFIPSDPFSPAPLPPFSPGLSDDEFSEPPHSRKTSVDIAHPHSIESRKSSRALMIVSGHGLPEASKNGMDPIPLPLEDEGDFVGDDFEFFNDSKVIDFDLENLPNSFV